MSKNSKLLLLSQRFPKPRPFDPQSKLIEGFFPIFSDAPIHRIEVPVTDCDFRKGFCDIADSISAICPETILVDSVNLFEMNPLKSGSWSSLIAMLVLTFPDARWLFGIMRAEQSGITNPSLVEARSMAEAFRMRFHVGRVFEKSESHLFDGDGLRKWIRDRMKEDGSEPGRDRYDSKIFPCRDSIALVLDDESDYRRLLGLMCYSKGFRVWAPLSWTEVAKYCENRNTELELTIEDWFLSFPDQPFRQMSDLRNRSELLTALRHNPPPIRRFVTVGHVRQKGNSATRRDYLRELRLNERLETVRPVTKSSQVVYKPASGLHTLWKNLGLLRAFRKTTTLNKDSPHYRHANGLAKGYIWPPPNPDKASANEETYGGHSAPGRLLQISEHLIQRATKLLEEVATVSDAVRGAILATQALELLGGKTPTVAVDALGLKHEFEVVAECQFVGVEFHLSMKERLAEIRQNLRAMKHWLHRDRQEAFLLNSEARIVKRIISVLDEYGEYEESVTCQNRLRTLHRKIRQHDEWRKNKVLRIAFWWVNYYLEWVQRSFVHFFGTLTLVILCFTAAFHTLEPSSTWERALHRTVSAMHTVGFPEPAESNEVSVTVQGIKLTMGTGEQYHHCRQFLGYAAALFGVINFGIFISMLYSRISRR